MKLADKIRLAAEAAVKDDRDKGEREAARQGWSQVRRAAREAFAAKGDWVGILNDFREREGFYTSAERAKMCAAFTDELVMRQAR